jgi:thioredoxin 1
MLPEMIVLTAQTFHERVATTDCLVLTFRKNCPNCQVLGKVINKCRHLFPDLGLAGVDADENASLLADLAITKVPTVLVYRRGAIAARRSGVMNPAELSMLVASTGA